MLGVVIGVGSVITMLALGRGAQRAVDEQLAALGANVITVTTGMRSRAGRGARPADAHHRRCRSAGRARRDDPRRGARQSSRQQVKLGNRNLNVNVIGTTPQYAEVNGYTLEVGRLLGDRRRAGPATCAVIGGDIARQLKQTPDELVGRTLSIRAMPFEIVGVYAMKGAVGFSNPDDDIYIPIETSQYRVTGDDRVQTIAVQVARDTALAQAMVTVERVLRRVHRLPPGRDNDFAIVDRKQFLATQQETTEILGFLLAGIAGVSLLVGGIGIMNIMLVTVTERTREIGVRMALGATRARHPRAVPDRGTAAVPGRAASSASWWARALPRHSRASPAGERPSPPMPWCSPSPSVRPWAWCSVCGRRGARRSSIRSRRCVTSSCGAPGGGSSALEHVDLPQVARIQMQEWLHGAPARAADAALEIAQLVELGARVRVERGLSPCSRISSTPFASISSSRCSRR